jgi:hypothetical protein
MIHQKLIKIALRDVFHIGLVIGPRSAVLAFGCASGQYSRPRTYDRFDHIKANKSKLINNSDYPFGIFKLFLIWSYI